MSLVGSLEDLALGDILQIVSLSRKSGLLVLRSQEGDGRIFFRDGLVQTASVKGAPGDLPALLVGAGLAGQAEVELALEEARSEGRSEVEAVLARADVTEERSVALLRDHVQQCVVRMFGWREGEFSFEVRDHMDECDSVLSLPIGINAQFLTIEASRIGDETGDETSGESGDGDDDFLLSGEVDVGGPAPCIEEADGGHEALAVATAARWSEEPEPSADEPPAPEPRAHPGPPGPGTALPMAGTASTTEATPTAPAPPATASPSARLPLVVIDPELPALEWAKSELDGIFARIHIFQHSEGGIARIRQYLGRAQLPVVLVSTAVPADSLTGATDVTELLGRLRAQAPRMTIVAIHEEGRELPPGVDAADGLVTRPRAALLVDAGARDETRAAGAELVSALRPFAYPSEGVVAPAPVPRRRSSRLQTTAAALQALEEVSARLRDPATRGEVLNLVLDFAARRFRRVAMFMVTDDEAVGIAQRGLAEAGGPSDEAFRTLRVPLLDPAWFRGVTETGESLRAGPRDQGDRRLAARLGSRAPSEAFVAPIESGDRVAALLYADDLPENGPIGDTTALSIVLHEAGLALDRALRERALQEAGK